MIIGSEPIKMTAQIESEFGKLYFLVPNIVIKELKEIERLANFKRSRMARAALNVSTQFKKIDTSEIENVDENILQFAKKNKIAVATIDKELIRKLLNENIITLTLSNNKLIIAKG